MNSNGIEANPNNLYMANTSHLSSDLSLLHTHPVLYRPKFLHSSDSKNQILAPPQCNLFKGHWDFYPNHKPVYNSTCPFHRNSWNCIRNQRENTSRINSWKWVLERCDLNWVNLARFLGFMRNKNIGFVGDSLNENFLVSFLCILRVAGAGAKKWKRKGAWRGAYFPKFNVTMAYHRPVLLAKYK